MINKYFGITLISASLAFVGCSSNDDDGDTSGGTDGTTNPAPTAITVPTEYTPADGVTLSLVETLTNPPASADGTTPSFNTLLQAVSDAGLVAAVSGDGPLTIFAPTDAAFEALGQENIPTDADTLANILQYHIVAGALDATLVAGSVGLSAEALQGGSLAVTQDGDALKIAGAGFVQTDIGTTNGIIHAIDAVLLPPATGGGDGGTPPATDGGTPPATDGGTPPATDGGDPDQPNLGATINALRDSGYTEYVTLHNSSGLGTVYDDNAWTAFVPNNAAIPDGVDQGSAFDILNNHIITSGALTAQELATGGDRTANGGAALTFGGTADALTVNGFSATRITVDGTMSTIYVIDGVITP